MGLYVQCSEPDSASFFQSRALTISLFIDGDVLFGCISWLMLNKAHAVIGQY